jgi:hypothetical protein
MPFDNIQAAINETRLFLEKTGGEGELTDFKWAMKQLAQTLALDHSVDPVFVQVYVRNFMIQCGCQRVPKVGQWYTTGMGWEQVIAIKGNKVTWWAGYGSRTDPTNTHTCDIDDWAALEPIPVTEEEVTRGRNRLMGKE